jgi:hypothetical protein
MTDLTYAELLREAEEEIDRDVTEKAASLAQAYLDAGAELDELPVLMEGFVTFALEQRAHARARLRAIVGRHSGAVLH